MAVINVSTLVDILGGTDPVDAKIVAVASSAQKPTVRYLNDDVVFPQKIEVEIVAGVPEEDFELTTLPVGLYWSVGVYCKGLSALRRTVRVPAGAGPFDFDELIDVDPSTALPDPNSAAAEALVAELQATIDSISGATGTFTSANNKTITVVDGIITSIVP